MQLQLALSGIAAEIEIKGYSPNNRTEYGCTWCQIDYSLKAEPWLKYEKSDAEVLTAEEIDYVTENLEQLLNGQLCGRKVMNFIEPDFAFALCQQEDTIHMDWKIRFWEKEKGLTANYLSVRLYLDEIEKLWKYLRTIQQGL